MSSRVGLARPSCLSSSYFNSSDGPHEQRKHDEENDGNGTGSREQPFEAISEGHIGQAQQANGGEKAQDELWPDGLPSGHQQTLRAK